MDKLQALLETLQNDEQVIRFKKLESIIDHNGSINKEFQELLDLQKVMVQKEVKIDPNLEDAKSKYEKKYSEIMKYPILEEYLDLLEVINNDLTMIKSIIEQEIAKDFD